jgi:acyl-CoA thioesterase-1
MKFSAYLLKILLCACCLLPAAAAARESGILVFGDSLSAAYGMPKDAGWVALLQQKLSGRHLPCPVVNASISGETAAGGLRRLPAALSQHHPAIVILELGANDGLRGAPVADIEANLGKMIRQSRKAGAAVLLLGMQLPPNYGADYTAAFKEMYGRLAQRYHTARVDFLLEGVAQEQFQADNLHPVAGAQARLLQNVMLKLEPLLHK